MQQLRRIAAVTPITSGGALSPPADFELVGSHRCPVMERDGISYCLVPQFVLRTLRESRDTLAWLSVGAGLVAVGAIAAHIIKPPPMVVEKPVLVEKPVIVEKEKPVPVDRNCILFCGDK